MTQATNTYKIASLLGASALTLTMSTFVTAQAACATLDEGVLRDGCEQPNADVVSTGPVPVNTEDRDGPVLNNAGFSLSLDGVAIDSDLRITNQIRRTDIALANANIQVSFDGLNPIARLNVETVGAPRRYAAGETVTIKSEINYPRLVQAGQLRLIDRGAAGGPRLLGVVPIKPNGTASFVVPEGEDIVVVHRVTDARGRFDETEALPLGRPDDRGLSSDYEEGFDFTAERNIPIRGGAITVAATGVSSGAVMTTLGERVRPDQDGKLVIQRILPAGEYAVDVAVSGAGTRATELSRDVEIPGAEWFVFALGDLTVGRFEDGASGDVETRTTGRLRYYIDGETENGVQITTSLDTGEGEIDEIFRRLDEKDPRSVLARVDPSDSYPTFGDDSSSVDNTPTSGKIYLRVEQDGNFVLWGDYQAQINGSAYLRNERTLYGAQAEYKTQSSTTDGDARGTVSVYAAQPDQLVGRDVFEGTGGSVYFLRRQDLTIGSETLTVELRDAGTGRVVERRTLVRGRDYDINYIQGYVRLASPLSGGGNDNLIQTNPGGDITANLVAQYEFTPTATDVDGFAYGGRVEGWVSDNLRLGATGLSETTGPADQTATGVDLRYQFGDNSFVQLDYAETDGPGFGNSFSADAGLIVDDNAATAGNGRAVRIEGQADWTDLGYDRTGVVGGYFEDRTAGFSTLDYQVTDDEKLYGFYAQVEADERLGWKVYGDRRESGDGTEKTELGAELETRLGERTKFAFGIENLDETTVTSEGQRTVLAADLEYAATERLSYRIFGQGTVANDGLSAYDRYGVGLKADFQNGWTISGELSDGTGGIGGRILAERSDSNNASTYFGYELDPGRAIDAGLAPSANGGKYVLGGRRQISDSVSAFGENTYDIFDTSRKLTSAYGVEYIASDFLTYDSALELAQVEDSTNGDFDRTAVSFGVRYEDSALIARGRIEYRTERADDIGTRPDADTILFSTEGRYKIDEEQRLLFSLSAADTETDETSLLNGSLIDANLGYGYRPILNERLNVLARYRYLYDMYGQTVNGVTGSGPVQESHVFSIEGNYDLTRDWTIGAKLGGRFTESAVDGNAALQSNDAALVVLNARYQVTEKWDVLAELRQFEAFDAEQSETSVLGVVSRKVGEHVKVGVGYNFGSFSDDLTDLTYDDQGVFVNIVASF